MAKRARKKTNRRWGRRLWDICLTLIFIGVLIVAIVMLDRLNVEVLKGRATVIDGDSIVLNDRRMRLLGIDAPELYQTCTRDGMPWACGKASRTALKALLSSQLECTTHGEDKYQRQLVVCRGEGVEHTKEMVRRGWALDYGGYAQEQASAQKAHLGIWRSSFDLPQDWRRERGTDRYDLKSGVIDWRSGLRKMKSWLFE